MNVLRQAQDERDVVVLLYPLPLIGDPQLPPPMLRAWELPNLPNWRPGWVTFRNTVDVFRAVALFFRLAVGRFVV